MMALFIAEKELEHVEPHFIEFPLVKIEYNVTECR